MKNNVRQAVSALIINADIFTGNRATPRIQNGAIAVNDGLIVDLGSSQVIESKYQPVDLIDVKGAIVHPGMIDTHLHAMSVSLHGLPIAIDNAPTGRQVSYAAVKVETDDMATEALTKAASIALLRRGYTCFIEAGTVFETDAFASGLQAVGMRGMVSAPFGWDNVSLFEALAPGMITPRLMERVPADTDLVLKRLERELSLRGDRDGLVTAFVCLYGEGSATEELTRQAHALARKNNVLYNQHQGFLPQWHDAVMQRDGETGVARLQRLGILNPDTLLSHMNVMSDRDFELVLEAKPGITWCPNNALHRAVHPNCPCRLPSLARSGVPVSLGIDTTMYHSLGTMGTGSLLLSAMVGERLDDSEPFYMQTAIAAKNIGFGDELGTIAVGKRADIVVRRTEDITHTPLDDQGALLAMSSSQVPVDLVMINGDIVMKGGQTTKVDQSEVLRAAVEQRSRLVEKAMA
ncbi:amidohydrolase family protein, partial [Mesorhizobium sp. M0984]|uniref:amidohydrolase family protein n=1 Tax=unclassified Mesorhizobium TaxID=325217 RepID=UPI00333D6136